MEAEQAGADSVIDPSVCAVRTAPIIKQKENRKMKPEDKEVSQWVAYIKGEGRKPKSLAPTLISLSRPERAANKPLVSGSIEGVQTKIFFDTGAEINVIDESFFNVLKKNNPSLKVESANIFVRCANDSKMKAIGKVTLNLLLQGVLTRQIFTIVRGIFPKVIVGIRQMKKSQIAVDPKNDCIWISNKRVPFVSKIDSIEDQENCQQLARRV
jgi:hypothetical protein